MKLPLARKLLSTFVFTRSGSVARYQNLARAAWEHFVLRPDRVSAKPLRLVVDPTNHCNLSCPLCPTGQGRQDRPRATMKSEDFERIIDELGDTLFEVDLFGWGEPLLNPSLPQMIAYASRKRIRTNVSSHCNHMSDSLARALVDAKLSRLIVSLDGASPATYAQYRQGGDFDTVLANVQRMRRMRGAGRTPQLVWQFLVMRHNEHELDYAKRNYKQLGFDALSVRAVRTDMGREVEWSDAERVSGTQPYLPSTDTMSRYDYRTKTRKAAPSQCSFLWTQASIDPSGRVSPCCAIYETKHDVGTLKQHSFADVWNGPAYRALRSQVRRKDASPNTACSTCVKHGFIEY